MTVTMFQRKRALQDMVTFLVAIIALATSAPSSHVKETVLQRMQRAASSSTVNCTSAIDAWYCGSYWPPSYCDRYYNVPPTCPFMCKLCQVTSPPSSTFSSVSTTGASTTKLATTTSTAAPSTKVIIATSTVKAVPSATTSKPGTTASLTTSNPSGCPSPSYPPTHTACLSMSAYAVNPRGVSAVEKKQIVDTHNNLRRLQGATDMQLMVWDDEVAYVAQKWSDNCNFNHDSQRDIPNKYSAGQNIAYGYATWNGTIMAWYNEVNQFTYGSSSYNFPAIGHYTQIVWNSTARIGCGATTCTNLRAIFYVCNYAPAGNNSPQIPFPYTRGTQCAACPGRCNNGLCDCGGLVCKNGGTLNLNTCQCTCQSPYTGMPDCNLNCTGVVDRWYCGSQWPSSYCTRYSNVPYECPIMCSICPATSKPSSTLSSASTRGASTTKLTTIAYRTTTVSRTSTAAPSTKVTSATSTVKAVPSATTSKPATTASLTTSNPSGCPSPSYPPTHTACLSMSAYAVNPRGISAVEKKQIVDTHNNLRRLQGATDMQLMVWDDEVAYVAQKWSDNCNFNHDSQRDIPNKYSAGQNIAYGYATWNGTIMAWYSEVNQFTYGSSSYNFPAIGHYTQIVWNSTARIGCGATTCTNLRAIFYVCNYAPAGNNSPQIPFPYTRGTQCAACPGRCNNGLCDCGGLVCKNGGTLNLNTCQCTCQSPYTAMPDCNLNCTGVVDRWYCGSQWPSSYCTRYSNVPYECPIMCSICPAA